MVAIGVARIGARSVRVEQCRTHQLSRLVKLQLNRRRYSYLLFSRQKPRSPLSPPRRRRQRRLWHRRWRRRRSTRWKCSAMSEWVTSTGSATTRAPIPTYSSICTLRIPTSTSSCLVRSLSLSLFLSLSLSGLEKFLFFTLILVSKL